MKEKISEYIENQDYTAALEEISGYLENMPFDDEIASLAAISLFNLGLYDSGFEYILKGLESAPENYELYMLLGNYYAEDNDDLSYLCFMQAFKLCKEQCGKESDDAIFLSNLIEDTKRSRKINVNPVSVIVYCENCLTSIDVCIKSILDNCGNEADEIIIIDNASNDKTREYIEKNFSDPRIKLICEDTRIFFSAAMNKCIKASNPKNDIFIISGDCIVAENALFTLRLGLYSSKDTASAGCLLNISYNGQEYTENFDSMEEYLAYFKKNNIPKKNCMESKFWLSSFGVLFKRMPLSETGLFNENFKGKYSSEYDIGRKLTDAGYNNYICHNSRIFTLGSIDSLEYDKIVKTNIDTEDKELLNMLYGIYPFYYSMANSNLTGIIAENSDTSEDIHVLEVGCGIGATLMNIKYIFPNASVYGIEIVDKAAEMGRKKLNIITGDIESMELPYPEGEFDYIIFGDVLEHLKWPEEVLIKMKKYLKPKGCIVTSIPNILNAGVIYDLLVNGDFTYQPAGILDRTHLRFFTYNEIIRMFQRCGYSVIDVLITVAESQSTQSEPYKDFFDKLTSIEGVVDRVKLDTYQYILIVQRKDD